MKNQKRLFKISLSLLLLILIIHNVFHFSFFGTGISGFYEKGISGFSIGKLSIGEEIKTKYRSVSPLSITILLAEWSLLILAVFFAFLRNRVELKKEIAAIKSPGDYKKTNKSTDLDALYNLLKEKKHLRLSSIAEKFKIEKELALEWAKTLESASLVYIDYPRFGDPEIYLEE